MQTEAVMLDKKSIQIMNYLINEEEISLTKLMSKTSLSKNKFFTHWTILTLFY